VCLCINCSVCVRLCGEHLQSPHINNQTSAYVKRDLQIKRDLPKVPTKQTYRQSRGQHRGPHQHTSKETYTYIKIDLQKRPTEYLDLRSSSGQTPRVRWRIARDVHLFHWPFFMYVGLFHRSLLMFMGLFERFIVMHIGLF